MHSEKHELIYESQYSQILDELFAYFDNPLVDEVLLNGSAQVILVEGTKYLTCKPIFASKDAMVEWLYQFSVFVKVRLDPMQPFAGGTLGAGREGNGGTYRWHCVLPPIAAEGPLFSLRRNRFDALSLDHFNWNPQHRKLLEQAVLNHLPVLIVGPTGSGKTSLLVAVLRHLVGVQERTVFLETLAEIPMLEAGWIRLVEKGKSYSNQGAIGIDALLKESLRLRPDRYVIGEIRSTAEAQAFLQACLTGHGGAFATMHGSSYGGSSGGNGLEQVLFRLAHLLSKHPSITSNIRSIKKALYQQLGNMCLVCLERGTPPQVKAVELLSED